MLGRIAGNALVKVCLQASKEVPHSTCQFAGKKRSFSTGNPGKEDWNDLKALGGLLVAGLISGGYVACKAVEDANWSKSAKSLMKGPATLAGGLTGASLTVLVLSGTPAGLAYLALVSCAALRIGQDVLVRCKDLGSAKN